MVKNKARTSRFALEDCGVEGWKNKQELNRHTRKSESQLNSSAELEKQTGDASDVNQLENKGEKETDWER